MKKIAIIISLICLALTIVPAFLVYFQVLTLEANKTLMLVGTIGWFITASYWMNTKENQREPSE